MFTCTLCRCETKWRTFRTYCDMIMFISISLLDMMQFEPISFRKLLIITHLALCILFSSHHHRCKMLPYRISQSTSIEHVECYVIMCKLTLQNKSNMSSHNIQHLESITLYVICAPQESIRKWWHYQAIRIYTTDDQPSYLLKNTWLIHHLLRNTMLIANCII